MCAWHSPSEAEVIFLPGLFLFRQDGFLVGDALVAVDAGLAGLGGVLVLGAGAGFLLRKRRGGAVVAVAAFARVVGLHRRPDRLRHLETVRLELLGRVDAAEEVAGDFVERRLDLAPDLR